jgi:hypothetical protein
MMHLNPCRRSAHRFFARVVIFLSSLLFANVFAASRVSAQDAKLIDAAKKEGGKIVAYGSLESNTVEPIIEAFNKKNRPRGGILARLRDESNGSGLGRAARRQTRLRCHGEQ